MLMKGSVKGLTHGNLCTFVTQTKAEQLRVQMKAESNGESGTAFLKLLKRAQKPD